MQVLHWTCYKLCAQYLVMEVKCKKKINLREFPEL